MYKNKKVETKINYFNTNYKAKFQVKDSKQPLVIWNKIQPTCMHCLISNDSNKQAGSQKISQGVSLRSPKDNKKRVPL